jgi:hypothetical protein
MEFIKVHPILRTRDGVEYFARFELIVVLEIRKRVQELQVSNGDSWKAFVQALKEEYFIEDLERVTK